MTQSRFSRRAWEAFLLWTQGLHKGVKYLCACAARLVGRRASCVNPCPLEGIKAHEDRTKRSEQTNPTRFSPASQKGEFAHIFAPDYSPKKRMGITTTRVSRISCEILGGYVNRNTFDIPSLVRESDCQSVTASTIVLIDFIRSILANSKPRFVQVRIK